MTRGLPYGTISKVTQRIISVIWDAFGPFFRVFFFTGKLVSHFGVALQLDLLDEVFAAA